MSPTQKQIAPHAKRAELEDGAELENSNLTQALRPPPMAAARLDSAIAESRARYMGDADPKNTEFDGTLMRPPAAARYLGLSESTLAKMRLRGDGPPYYKLGKRAVAYMRPELAEWAARRRRKSTSEIVHVEGAS